MMARMPAQSPHTVHNVRPLLSERRPGNLRRWR
jgi:hypothetical protein